VTVPAQQLGLLPSTWPTLVVDWPWAYDDSGARGGVDHHYKTLTIAQGIAMPVHELSWPHAHLWFWVTNSFMEAGFKFLRAWGFEFKTILTWDKEKIGNGHYLRGQTEHVLFGTRGRAPILARNIPTIFRAPRGEHSEKPDAFYRLVERASPGPYLSLFERKQRGEGWSTWGDEAVGGIRLPALERVLAR
jgi:N6-adenosine-specific RNA methylase IME4